MKPPMPKLEEKDRLRLIEQEFVKTVETKRIRKSTKKKK